MNSREIVEMLIEVYETRLQKGNDLNLIQDLPQTTIAYATLLLARRAVT